MGTRYLSKLQGGMMDQLMYICGIIGLMVVGGMVASMVGVTTPIQFASMDLVLQDILDSIIPQMLSLAVTFGLYALVKKRVSTGWLLLVCIIGGIILNSLGVMA